MNVGEVLGLKNTLNQFHIAAPEFLRGRKKRDVAKSGEYLQPYVPYPPLCLMCGISDIEFGEKCVFLFFFFSAK